MNNRVHEALWGLDFFQRLHHDFALILEVRVTQVIYVNNAIGKQRVFECSSEASDQLGGNVANETDRIHIKYFPQCGELSFMTGHVEGGEQLVLWRKSLGIRQLLDQRRFAGVCVADDCDNLAIEMAFYSETPTLRNNYDFFRIMIADR